MSKPTFVKRLAALPSSFKIWVGVSLVIALLAVPVGIALLSRGHSGPPASASVPEAQQVSRVHSVPTHDVSPDERARLRQYYSQKAADAERSDRSFVLGPDDVGAQSHSSGATPSAGTVVAQPASRTVHIATPAETAAQQRKASAAHAEFVATRAAKLKLMEAINRSDSSGPAVQIVSVPGASQAQSGGGGGINVSGGIRPDGTRIAPGSSDGGSAPAEDSDKLSPGDVLFATLDTDINSDEPGPVRVTIVGGRLDGAHMTGTYTRGDEAVTLKLNTLSWHRHSTAVTATAIDADKFRTYLATDVDHHYILRWGGLLLSGAAAGGLDLINRGTIGQSSGTQNGAVVVQPRSPTGREIAIAAVGGAGQQFVGVAQKLFSLPNTVYVSQGTEIGVMFLAPVTDSWVPSFHSDTQVTSNTP